MPLLIFSFYELCSFASPKLHTKKTKFSGKKSVLSQRNIILSRQVKYVEIGHHKVTSTFHDVKFLLRLTALLRTSASFPEQTQLEKGGIYSAARLKGKCDKSKDEMWCIAGCVQTCNYFLEKNLQSFGFEVKLNFLFALWQLQEVSHRYDLVFYFFLDELMILRLGNFKVLGHPSGNES